MIRKLSICQQTNTMSRRKQSNPKPLLKNDCDNPIRDMTISQQDQGESFLNEDDEQNSRGHASSATDELEMEQQKNDETEVKDVLMPSPLSIEISSPRAGSDSGGESSAQITPNISPSTSTSVTEVYSISPNSNKYVQSHEMAPIVSPIPISMPKLRLNATLASDPALQPEAKVIKRTANMDQHCDELLDDDVQMDEGPTPSLSSPQSVHSMDRSDDSRSENILRRDERRSSLKEVLIASVGNDVMPLRVPAFKCNPCGIKFSSASTLEAHQTYYCSHNKKNNDDTSSGKVSIVVDDMASSEPATKSIRTGKQYACTQCSYSADKKVSLNRHMRMHQTSPTTSPLLSNGTDYSSQIQQQMQVHQIDRYCSDCDIRFSSTKTYRAHKQHYCRGRHIDGQTSIMASVSKSLSSKDGSPSPTEKSKSPQIIGPGPEYLALPTTPIIIVPRSLINRGSVLRGPLSVSPGVTNPDITCFVFQNNILQPIAQALTLHNDKLASNSIRAQTPIAKSATIQMHLHEKEMNPSQTDILRPTRNKSGSQREGTTTPLDLSIRRMSSENFQRERSISISSSVSSDIHKISIDTMMEGKENLSINSDSVTPEQIVCAPSLPGSPPLTPSPKHSLSSPRQMLSQSPNALTSGLHNQNQQQAVLLRSFLPSQLAAYSLSTQLNRAELAINMSPVLSSGNNSELSPKPSSTAALSIVKKSNIDTHTISGGATSSSSTLPQVFVKQGVSKCKECNIVFCKYENYIAHKKHYCSARNLEENKESKSKPSPPSSPSPNHVGSTGGAMAYQQLICAACGIKFTSLDNLSAHQMYYCPKRIEVPVQQILKEKCSKCKITHDISQSCPSPQNIYKCPMCNVISSNAAESRKHLETHAGVKAFRCSICGYKGNTLRGMRTHIRMHFDKKSTDFNEEKYISCVLEDDNTDISTLSATQAAINNQNSSTSQSDVSVSQLHSCDKCNYSSTYKGNVVRHIKLVHTINSYHESNSSIVGEGGESLVLHNNVSKSSTPLSVIIKIEPEEVKAPTATETDIKEYSPKAIKIENNHDAADDDSDVEHLSSNIKPQLRSISDHNSSSLSPPVSQLSVPAISANLDDLSKYCDVCDIKFTFLNSFVAHKKYYCKNVKTNVDTGSNLSSPNQTTVLARTAEASVL